MADRPGHDQRYAIDASKVDAELDWRPRFDFEGAMSETVAWYLGNEAWRQAIQAEGDVRDRRGLEAARIEDDSTAPAPPTPLIRYEHLLRTLRPARYRVLSGPQEASPPLPDVVPGARGLRTVIRQASIRFESAEIWSPARSAARSQHSSTRERNARLDRAPAVRRSSASSCAGRARAARRIAASAHGPTTHPTDRSAC